jgi:hypothetical protein
MLDFVPDWPADDAAALGGWLKERGRDRLGRNTNAWLGLIFQASLHSGFPDISPEERKAFRDVAVAAVDEGWACQALPRDVYAEKQILVRMSYLRQDGVDAAWRQDEMTQVFDFFLEQVPLIMDTYREKSGNWQRKPVFIILAMRRIKTLLGLMSDGTQYLDGERASLFEEWVKIRPFLP